MIHLTFSYFDALFENFAPTHKLYLAAYSS